jgi:hypothetical protein
MKFKRKFADSPYPDRPGYVPEGTMRIRSKFCWLPVVGDKYIHWLERVVIEEKAKYVFSYWNSWIVEWQIVKVYPD